MRKKICEDRTCSFGDMLYPVRDFVTDTETDTVITLLRHCNRCGRQDEVAAEEQKSVVRVSADWGDTLVS